MKSYDDIINLPHHVSKKHPQMSMLDRAAQFSPFAALTGYGDAIDEVARVTEARIELADSERQEIGQVLREAYETGCPVEITHFVPDERKEGGAYAMTTGVIKAIESASRTVIFQSRVEIKFDSIQSAVRIQSTSESFIGSE